jgi:histidine ammonia-lyase
MFKEVELSHKKISLEDLDCFFSEKLNLSINESALSAIQSNRSFLEKSLLDTKSLIYGVNTGFGSLCDVAITREQIERLQYNLIVSHACGQGSAITVELSELILLLKIKNLSFGKSGVRVELVEKLIELFNKKVIPVIYEKGSLGASGDLAPLAHMSLPLLGLGKVWYNGAMHETAPLLDKLNINTLSLSAKEGLALINGTQFSLAFAIWACYHAKRIYRWANIIASASLQAYLCSMDPFNEELNKIRNQKGQILVAEEIRALCAGSEVLQHKYETVQDPYSFRCIPQVHGASKDTIDHTALIVERELNAVTDNPNILDGSEQILSGGNFHAQPLALVLDFLSIALSELGSISERRIFKLVNGDRGLPDYLTGNPGLNSGFMIPQYVAASMVSQNKQLSTPASVDSISSSKGQEDHVSMAANAATRIQRVVDNVYRILSIELMCAAQAIEFRKAYDCSPAIKKLLNDYRSVVERLENDRLLHNDLESSHDFIKSRNY